MEVWVLSRTDGCYSSQSFYVCGVYESRDDAKAAALLMKESEIERYSKNKPEGEYERRRALTTLADPKWIDGETGSSWDANNGNTWNEEGDFTIERFTLGFVE